MKSVQWPIILGEVSGRLDGCSPTAMALHDRRGHRGDSRGGSLAQWPITRGEDLVAIHGVESDLSGLSQVGRTSRQGQAVQTDPKDPSYLEATSRRLRRLSLIPMAHHSWGG
jgi:hypothetical protein